MNLNESKKGRRSSKSVSKGSENHDDIGMALSGGGQGEGGGVGSRR